MDLELHAGDGRRSRRLAVRAAGRVVVEVHGHALGDLQVPTVFMHFRPRRARAHGRPLELHLVRLQPYGDGDPRSGTDHREHLRGWHEPLLGEGVRRRQRPHRRAAAHHPGRGRPGTGLGTSLRLNAAQRHRRHPHHGRHAWLRLATGGHSAPSPLPGRRRRAAFARERRPAVPGRHAAGRDHGRLLGGGHRIPDGCPKPRQIQAEVVSHGHLVRGALARRPGRHLRQDVEPGAGERHPHGRLRDLRPKPLVVRVKPGLPVGPRPAGAARQRADSLLRDRRRPRRDESEGRELRRRRSPLQVRTAQRPGIQRRRNRAGAPKLRTAHRRGAL